MAPRYPVPIQEVVRDLLVDLLGRGVGIAKTGRLEHADGDVGVLGVYVDDDDEVAVVAVCDVPFAILVGAALVMVPPQVAKEQVAAGVVEGESVEVFREVINILARILNTPRTPHIRMSDVVVLPAELDEAVERLVAAPEFRRDFVVTLEDYGEGRISILAS